jgi:DNA topoisomerase-6 subunit B
MTSYQSRLGEGEGIAEELAESQRAISIAEFFEKNKHMLGFDSGARALVTAVKEAVDNALDATEEAGILPDIYVDIEEVGDYYRLTVEDNGPGITEAQIPKIFGKLLYGSRFHKREQSLTPDQQVLIRRDGVVESVPIGVLCDAYLPEDGAGTAPIAGNIEAPSFDRETREMTWQPVTHAIRHETAEQTYEIATQRGRTVEVTGNHSLFSVTETGETAEVSAADLEAGDTVLAPRRLPTPEDTAETVNLLSHLSPSDVEDRRVYVYGFETETLERLREGERVRKKPSPDSERERTYYRHDGVEILKDSFEGNYAEKGYLPAETVLELGWEERAAEQGCEFRTYQVGGEQTTLPVSLPLSEELMKLLGYYVAEGHAGPRQVGFTFGSHERGLVETTERALAGVGAETTTVERERNSTRVKAFGSPLALFLERACGAEAAEKRIPAFVFEAKPDHQRAFIEALYEGDGSDAVPGNELSHTTTSETLARQLSVLWNMQGVLASTEVADGGGYADEPATQYRTKVYGADVSVLDGYETESAAGEQAYKRVPTAVLDPVRVAETDYETVPDSIPGLLVGAGVGSSFDHAAVYRSLIEDALDGEYVETPRYVHNLQEMGLLDEDHRPTEELRTLWEAVQNLHGLTDSDMCLLPVESVAETDPPEYVYDISVPGATGRDENFVVVNDGPLAVKNSRGQQGIGISAAVLYSQLTSGKPAKITSRTQGDAEAQYFELIVDTDENEPEISTAETTSWDRPHGTRIELEMEANMRARGQLRDYIKHTAVVNPHARIELREPDGQFKYERATDELPAETEEIRPHPHGVELGALIKMAEATDSYSVSGFLQGEFTRVGGKTADSVIDNFRDRHFGREMAWRPPREHEAGDLESAVREAVANKGAEATAAFAERVAAALAERERVAHQHVLAAVTDTAETIEAEYDTTFGETVREKATAAAWETVTGERESDVYALVDEATTKRKDDAHVRGLAERLAAKFGEAAESRHRVTRETLAEYVRRAADAAEEYDDATFGETARENVVDALWGVCERVPDDPPRIGAVAEDRDTASELLEAMRETDIIAPPTGCLAPITEELVEAGLRKEFDADFYAAATRDASVHGGDPFIVEAGIAYGGEVPAEGPAQVMRFANRVPLVYQRGACATTDVVKDINWRNYGLDQPGGSGIPNGPAVVMVHIASTNVPFTSESKDAVANVPEIESEIELAIREAARELKSYLNKRRSMQQRREKQDKLATILPEMAEKLSRVTGRDQLNIDDTMARIMNNVLVERDREGETVRLTVENNTDASTDLEVTDITTAEPTANGDATVVEMDGEYFLKWSPTVPGGESATLEYSLDSAAECEIAVEGIEDEKLTVDA